MPPEGIPLAERFSPDDVKRMFDNLRRMGEPLGIVFGDVKTTSNSRTALQASEFARDCGRYDSFHDRVFHAYFTEARDIGSLEVVLDLAEAEGLDPGELVGALENETYMPRLARARKEGEALGVRAVPTFIVEGTHRIVGTLPLEQFKERLARVAG